ncbi:MAG: EpsG family protein [Dysgonomonas sp.]|nr:EpsG family protein [Dysgonomonas sp.]
MAVYLISAILFALVGYETFNPKSQLNGQKFFFIWIVLSLFWGLSFVYAPDIPGYIAYFNKEVYDWFESGFKLPKISFEYGFNVLSCILKSLNNEYYVYQLILFSSELLLVMIGLKKLLDTNNTIIFVCALFFILPLNLLGALRQGISISLFIFSLHYIIERNLLKYILIIVFASFFHKSSLFLLLLFWIPKCRSLLLKKNILLACLVILNICYFSGFSISNSLNTFLLMSFDLYEGVETYARYTDAGVISSNFGLAKVFEMNVVYILFLIVNKDDSKAIELLKLFFLVYFMLNMLLGGILAHRIGYYFILIYQICLIMSFCMFAKHLLKRPEIGFLFTCVYFIFLNLFYFQNSLSKEIVYRNLFWEHIFNGSY